MTQSGSEQGIERACLRSSPFRRAALQASTATTASLSLAELRILRAEHTGDGFHTGCLGPRVLWTRGACECCGLACVITCVSPPWSMAFTREMPNCKRARCQGVLQKSAAVVIKS